jgi:hypothetical protein
MKILEAEDDVKITYNINTVIKKLAEINKSQFRQLTGSNDVAIHTDNYNGPLKSRYLMAKKSKKAFENFSVKVGIKNPTNIEKEIFLRLNVLVHDAVSNKLSNLLAYVYFTDGPLLSKKQDFIFEYFEFTMRKGDSDVKEIERIISQKVRELNLLDKKQELKKFIAGYCFGSSNFEFPLEYFKQTGMVVSKYHIYKLFTPENAQKVWGKLEVKVGYRKDINR